MSPTAILIIGFLLGVRHATDADHVVAVSAIVAREKNLRSAAPIGVAWGVGHAATLFVLGGVMLAFGLAISPRVGLGMELLVALMLVLLGVLNLRAMLRPLTPHSHEHGLGARDDRRGRSRLFQLVRPLVVGMVHGLAGSAAIALLVLGSVHTALQGVVYLLLFGAGTVVGMLVITVAFAMPLALSARRFARVNRALAACAGVCSIGFGAYLFYRIGVVDGLFTSHPRWTPQ